MHPLPIDEYLAQILKSLKEHPNLVIMAAPGAGKTTRFPAALMDSGMLTAPNQKIIMLQPRRIAARAAAARICEERGLQLGSEVGYQVRFENRTQASTVLSIVTEGILARLLLQDPELTGVGAVILDEFHERSLHSDLALGLLKELQTLSRPDLRIIVMSATLQSEPVAKLLNNCPVVDIPGRLFQLKIHHSERPQWLRTGPEFINTVCHNIKKAFNQSQRDLLAFLPGAGEIRRCQEALDAWALQLNALLIPLHGNLKLDEQNRALKTYPQRKVVLATNIAETSLTLDGVDTVVDSGLARVSRQDPSDTFSSLEISRISRVSAIQRAGRAGRQFPGQVFRLWSQQDELSMKEQEVAEVHRSDLSEACLLLAGHGITDFRAFAWLEPPSEATLIRAVALLQSLEILDAQQRLTAYGRKALKLSLHPRLARLMIEAQKFNLTYLGASLSSLLQERDMIRRDSAPDSNLDSDILFRLEIIEDTRDRSTAVDRSLLEQIRRARDQLFGANEKENWTPQDVQKLLFAAFPDRLCRRRRSGERAGIMVGGRGVALSPTSCVRHAELFLALQAQQGTQDSMVTMASPVDKNWLLQQPSIYVKSQIVYDGERHAIVKQEGRFFKDLAIDDLRVSRASAAEACDLLPEMIFRQWERLLQSREDLQQWLLRLQFLRQHLPEENFPELNDEKIRAAIDAACMGASSWDEIVTKDLIPYFEISLTQNQKQVLRKEAPAQLIVPSGRTQRITYHSDRAPHLEVRIQEVFGMHHSPKLARGRVSLVMHLLAPNHRPAQVTADLSSFWKTAYAEVRKELRARYPKHSWPEDPLIAPPQAKPARRK